MIRILALALFLLVPSLAHAQGAAVVTQCINPYPVNTPATWTNCNGVTMELGLGTGTTGAVVGTLAASASHTTYICGFNVSAIGGSAAVGPITIAGTVTGSMIFQLTSSTTGASTGTTFSPCIPASAANTTITVTTTADGSASAVDVQSWGFQQ